MIEAMKLLRLCPAVLIAVFLVVPTGARADTLGQNSTFFVDSDYDAAGASSLTATLQVVGAHAYWYVDDRYTTSLTPSQQAHFSSALNQLANTFDGIIYPRSTSFWGFERTPGIDNDSHVVILIERMIPTAGGYFQTVDNYPRNVAPQSNAREMFYLNAESILGDGALDFVAHEFQHLISFNQKEILQGVHDDTWTNEARSEYNLTNVGFTDSFSGSQLQYRMFSFMRSPSDSLVEWPNVAADYGITSVFMHYLADRFGPDLAAGTIRIPQAGVAAVNAWLFQSGRSERFGDVFTDWMVASYFNDPAFGAQYAYTRPELRSIRVTPQQSTSMGNGSQYAVTVPLKEWQPYWLQLNLAPDITASALNIQIAGQEDLRWGGAVMATYTDGTRAVTSFSATRMPHPISIPIIRNSGHLMSATLAVTQGTEQSVGSRAITAVPASITASFGDPIIAAAPAGITDGDLIRHGTEPEIYVIWGPYRRYLRNDVLALYGFQNRPVISVSDEVFNRYTTSNYIRSINGYKVYAVWPDGTKHWLNITAEQWDASHRDWNAIFIVNDSEVNFYTTGPDITR